MTLSCNFELAVIQKRPWLFGQKNLQTWPDSSTVSTIASQTANPMWQLWGN